MIGQDLHIYDLALCDYVVGNIVQHMDDPAFRAVLNVVLKSGPLLDFINQAQDDTVNANEMRLLLNENELNRLEVLFDGDLDRCWTPSEPVHRRYIETLKEVRDKVSRQAAEDWSDACGQFVRQLDDRQTRLSEGIGVIREWVDRLRTLLRVMGALAFVPAPEGAFPTPTRPEPPQHSCAYVAVASRPDEQDDTSLRTMLAETQALQREMRDLLVSQKTVKDWYTVEEFAVVVGKSEFTCREWCRLRRIHATKKNSGRGKHQSWAVSHDELLRYQKEGLLPQAR